MRKETFLQELKQWIGKEISVNTRDHYRGDHNWITITRYELKLASWGDYVGASPDLLIANNRDILVDFKGCKWLGNEYQGYGYTGLGFNQHELPARSKFYDQLLEVLEQLNKYPIYNDMSDTMYEVAEELWQENWEWWIEQEVKQELDKLDDTLDLDNFTEACWLFNRFITETENLNFETGSTVIIPDGSIEEFVKLLAHYRDDHDALEKHIYGWPKPVID